MLIMLACMQHVCIWFWFASPCAGSIDWQKVEASLQVSVPTAKVESITKTQNKKAYRIYKAYMSSTKEDCEKRNIPFKCGDYWHGTKQIDPLKVVEHHNG